MIQSFPPVASPNARILILGSMPGEKSLQENQYYAHPHNAFWPILCTYLRIPHDMSYDERLEAMRTHRIALWDVLKSCHRKGSLDTAIRNEFPNDFAAFFGMYSMIKTILFNGKKAESAFQKYVLKKTDQRFDLYALPSTSPANARLNLRQKQDIWIRTLKKI